MCAMLGKGWEGFDYASRDAEYAMLVTSSCMFTPASSDLEFAAVSYSYLFQPLPRLTRIPLSVCDHDSHQALANVETPGLDEVNPVRGRGAG